MVSNNRKSNIKHLARVVSSGLGLTWFELFGELWKFGKRIMRGYSNEGMYEVLDFASTLEIHDEEGKEATLHKRQKIRYMQDNIIAYQDQAWGDGDILLNYRCSPGHPVDKYRFGQKTHVLISLRKTKKKGDSDEFRITWGMNNGFLSNLGMWGTSINHRTSNIQVKVIFPKSRPPSRVWINLINRKHSKFLGEDVIQKLPDGRKMILWEKKKPRLYEHYVLHWEW